MGESAPDFNLSDLDGTPVRLSDFQGTETLVLF
jgi:peroxiredoxin